MLFLVLIPIIYPVLALKQYLPIVVDGSIYPSYTQYVNPSRNWYWSTSRPALIPSIRSPRIHFHLQVFVLRHLRRRISRKLFRIWRKYNDPRKKEIAKDLAILVGPSLLCIIYRKRAAEAGQSRGRYNLPKKGFTPQMVPKIHLDKPSKIHEEKQNNTAEIEKK